jgi:hypothetical protein
MRRTYVLVMAAAVVCLLSSPIHAQKRAQRTTPTKPSTSAEVTPETYSFETTHERWVLGDPEPKDSVVFDNAPLSIKARRLVKNTTPTGAVDITFPIGDYIFYEQDQTKPLVQSVVARYERGLMTALYIFYKPQSISMARSGFAPMGGNRGFYKTVSTVQRNGGTHTRQAISNGGSDSNGNLWIDTIAISMSRPGAANGQVARRGSENR